MSEKKGLYYSIHAKRARIAAGSGERMRKAGDAGAPTAAQFKQAAKTAKAEDGMMIPPTEERKPIAVTNPNDPRLKAYRDSLATFQERQQDLARLHETKRVWDRTHKGYKLVQDSKPYKDYEGKDRIGYTFRVGDPNRPMETNAAVEGTNVLAPTNKKPEQPVVLKKGAIDTIGENVPATVGGKQIGTWNMKLASLPKPIPPPITKPQIIVPADIQPKQVSTNITSDIEKREPTPIPAFIKRNIAEKSPSLAYPAQNQNFFERMRSKITGETPMPYWIDKQGIKRYPSKGESSPKAVKEIAMLKEGLDPKVPEDAAELKRIDYLLGKKNKQVLKAIENPKK